MFLKLNRELQVINHRKSFHSASYTRGQEKTKVEGREKWEVGSVVGGVLQSVDCFITRGIIGIQNFGYHQSGNVPLSSITNKSDNNFERFLVDFKNGPIKVSKAMTSTDSTTTTTTEFYDIINPVVLDNYYTIIIRIISNLSILEKKKKKA